MDHIPESTHSRRARPAGALAERYRAIRQVTRDLAAPLSAEDCAIQVASHPVTHGDFIEFIDDGGCQRPELWLSAGWELASARGWEAPQYWRRRDGAWRTSTLHGLAPVDAHTPAQAFDEVWEWTRSDYGPYPGYRPAAGAVGEYNGKFMSSQYVLRGGSCATPASHIRATWRNFFPPQARWQFSGLRLARDA